MAEYYIAPKSSFDATADAIRAKTGSQASIEWTEDGFADAIDDIPSGNDREDLCEPKDVDFIDFDGKLLYSYTAQEFLALSALPANPSYNGLIAQGWNWTLADAKEYVGQYGALVIGQNYTTDDGKTRIYIHITPQIINLQIPVEILATATVANGLKVYWGDGNESTWSGGANANSSGANHIYTTPGDYIIEIEVVSGAISFLGRTGANSGIVGGNTNINTCVQKIEIGNDVTGLAQNTFGRMRSLKSVSVPITVLTINDYDESMFGNNQMGGFVFPKDFTTTRYRAFFVQYSNVKYVSIPKGMNNFAFSQYPTRLRKLTMYSMEPSNGVNNKVYLYNCPSLTHYVVMGTYQTIGNDHVRESMIKKLFIPASVNTINDAFPWNDYLEEVHLYPTTPPNLTSLTFRKNAGHAMPTFYVPYSADHSILEAYQTATNWSTYASQMQEEPQ